MQMDKLLAMETWTQQDVFHSSTSTC